ncbi:MAG: hypothetical protein KDD33_00240 [Bdellovibrionales bacterium]|nr:hypothetical protein [Bdellovibrionales bacterium]
MLLLTLSLYRLTKHSKNFRRFVLLMAFAMSVIPTSLWAAEADLNQGPQLQAEQNASAAEVTSAAAMNAKACEAFLVSNDLEEKYEKLRKNLEKDFESGLPFQLRKKLNELRKQTDQVSVKLFDIEKSSGQEINNLVSEAIGQLDSFIALLPEISNNAPKVRDAYVVPITNLSSLRADHQECLMKAAVENVKAHAGAEREVSSASVYSKLTEEMNRLNSSLYLAETSDVQKFVALRTDLYKALESYNKSQNPDDLNNVLQKIPRSVNGLQAEIEKIMPGLELSKKYFSIMGI